MAKFYRHTVNGLVPIDSEKADKEYVDGKINNLQNSIDDITDVINVDSSDNKFVITDTNGNIGLKLDESGLSVKDVTAGDHILSEKADQSEVDKKLDRDKFEDVISIAGDNEFIITDENGNIGFKLDSNSAKAKDFTTSDDVSLSGVNAGLTGAISRLSTIEGLLAEDGNEVIDNIKDVIDYFNGVKETETGVALLSSVASHTSQISNLSDSVNTNTNNITTNTTTIASLSTRVTTNESNISKKLNKTEFTDVINVDGGNNEFVISDKNGNIGFKLDSNSAKAKDFTTSDDVSLNDVGERLTDVESSIGMESITYNNLSLLRDKKSLIPGRQYRITDYVTTTKQENTKSANHQFDIIVTADNNDTLNEIAIACLHEGDTYFSELNANLAAWKIWYCLDNDTNRFGWVDSTNGKGVIYRMIDEWDNDCPYDFKNIMFKKWLYADGGGITTEKNTDYIDYCYTFSYQDQEHGIMDASIVGNNGYITDKSDVTSCVYGNVIGVYIDVISDKNSRELNNIVFLATYKFKGLIFNGFYSNTFGDNCYNNTFGNESVFNTFCSQCYNNTFGNGCSGNTFEIYCYNNTFGTRCNRNTFKNNCHSNTFGNHCNGNTFENYCHNNTFGDYCSSNTFESSCHNNTFDKSCEYNTFGIDCGNNSFGIDVKWNSFGIDVYNITLGDDSSGNTFGDNCSANTFGDNCCANTFGNELSNNNFGDKCWNNTFGSAFYRNTLGNEFKYNTLGDNCSSNTFTNNCSNNTFCDNITGIEIKTQISNKSYIKIGDNLVDLATKPSIGASGNDKITITVDGKTSDAFTVPYATSASSLSLSSKVGDTNQPVYFSADGKPVSCSYTLEKSVPSDAKFTDTTYDALKNPNAIKFKNTSGTEITYDGSSEVDLSGGVYHATTASNVTTSELSDTKTLNLALVDSNNIKYIDTLKLDNSSKTLYANNLDISNNIFAKGTIFFNIENTAEIYHSDDTNTLHLNDQFLDLYADKTTITGNLECNGTCTVKSGIIFNNTNGNTYGSVDINTDGDIVLNSEGYIIPGPQSSGFKGNLSGNAASASKLKNTTAIGSSQRPVYFSALGVPNACTWGTSMGTGTTTYYLTGVSASNSGISYNTNITVSSNAISASGGFFESSDSRLKDIIEPVKVDLDNLSKLQKVYFNWKDKEKYGDRTQLGMIAQEVQEIYPELINESKDGQLSLAYDKLSVIALEAIDVLHNENNELKSRIERLESLVNQLTEKVND